jgi:hypothetical protein
LKAGAYEYEQAPYECQRKNLIDCPPDIVTINDMMSPSPGYNSRIMWKARVLNVDKRTEQTDQNDQIIEDLIKGKAKEWRVYIVF